VVVGHRGAAGYRPEHTLAGYQLAAERGADYLEPDLVATKDHVLVARHENDISETTDVAEHPEFASRRTTKTVDGRKVTGWFTEDFTLAELRTLRARERIPDVRPANARYDGKFLVPTFAEVLALRATLSRRLGRTVGVIPELKHPTYFASIGLPLEPLLAAALRKDHLDSGAAPVIVQCFEPTTLERLHRRYGLKVRTLLLTTPRGEPYDLVAAGQARPYSVLLQPAGLAGLARDGVDAIGPSKEQVVAVKGDGTLGAPTRLVADAHAAGLWVMPYTFRAENQYLPPALRDGGDPHHPGSAVVEEETFLRAGVDGLFCDEPDLCVRARAAVGS
jgi:glycerophosphoryl diester phosphodiesterase